MPKFIDKVFLFLYSLAIGIGAVFAALIGFRFFDENTLDMQIRSIMTDDTTAYTVAAVAVIIFLISLRLFVISVRRAKGKLPSIEQRTDLGDVSISVDTVENLALKAAGRIRGSRDIKARVKMTDNGLELMMRTYVDGDFPIPALSQEMQASVKEHIESITGIPVANVSVYVANVHHAPNTVKRVD